jgi:ubiquinone/menaquinone biosynthesis C-methylase UbiE
MTEKPEWLKRENRNWEKIYSDYHLTEIPWHSDKPDQELIDLIESKEINPSLVLDVGSGSGTDAIYFASIGCEVTAIDISHEAIKIAQERAEKAKVKVNFIAANFMEFDFQDQRFDFISDRGCFHHIHPNDREIFAVRINDLLKNNGFYFLRCWSDKEEETERGPYRLSKDEIRNTFLKFFKVGEIKDFRFGGRGARGYACLMKKEKST